LLESARHGIILGAMTATIDSLDVATLPLAPKNPLPIRQVLSAARVLHTGLALLSEAGGPVTRFVPLPKLFAPALVLVTSPNGVRDVLGRADGLTERCQIHQEVRNVAGDNLFVLPNREWASRRRALQPVFTKRNVDGFGRHMTEAAQTVADHWREVGEVDLDAECRRLAMRSLGRSILGVDVNEFGNEIAQNMHVASAYATDRALRPIRAPRWLPTPSRRRARSAVATMRQVTMDILQACRADPTRAGSSVDRGHRPRHRPAALRRRHLQRAADLHAVRPRHDGDNADLRLVGTGAPSRHAGPGRRRGCRDRG
jgi:cytochrome P450